MKVPRPIRAFAAGCLAGLFALGLDQLLAWLTLGFAVPLAPRHALAYVLLAAVFSLVWVAGVWGLKTVSARVGRAARR